MSKRNERFRRGVVAGAVLALVFALAPARAQDSETVPPPEQSEQEGVETPATPPPKAPDTPPPVAPPAPGPRDLFVAAAAAVAKAKSISYRGTSTGEGGLIATVTPTVRGDIQQFRASGGVMPGWRVRATGVSTPAKGGVPLEFDAAWLLGTVEWVDHANKKVYEKKAVDAKRARPFTASNAVRMDDLSSGRPFGKELDGTGFVAEEPRTIGGVPCEVVVVATGKSNVRARWYFATTDHLPRRVERIIAGKGEESRVVLELTDVRAESTPGNPELVRVRVPEGYTEERVQPPVVEPPPPVSPDVPGMIDEAPVPSGPRAAPAFELATAGGERVSSASLKGGIVALEFGGTWSLPLRESRPLFNEFVKRWEGRGLRGYSLGVRERSRDAAVDAHRAGGFAFGLLLDADGAARDFGVRVFPAYALIGPGGELLIEPTLFKGEATFEAMSRAVEEALAKMPAAPKDGPPGG